MWAIRRMEVHKNGRRVLLQGSRRIQREKAVCVDSVQSLSSLASDHSGMSRSSPVVSNRSGNAATAVALSPSKSLQSMPASIFQRRELSSNYTGSSNNNDMDRPGAKQPLLKQSAAREMTQIMKEPEFHKLGAFSASTWHQTELLLRSWSQLRTEEGVELSFTLLERLLKEQEFLLQNTNSTATAASAICKAPMTDQEHQEIQQLSRAILSTDLLNFVINNWRNAWKNQKTNLSPRKVLFQLEDYMDRSPSLHPDTKSYNMLLDAVTKRYAKKRAEQFAEEIFHRMSKQSTPTSTPVAINGASSPTRTNKLRCINDTSPDNFTFCSLINVYSYSQNPKAAEAVLSQCHKNYLEGRSTVQPNVYTFTAAINAWAQSRAPDAPEKAESIVQLMHILDEQQKLSDVKPSVVTYNALLNCWAKSGRDNAGEKAAAILNQMESNHGVRPNLTSCNTVLYALTDISNNLDLAESVLQSMYPRPMPDRDSYHFVLRCLHKNAHEVGVDCIEKAELYLGRMIQSGIHPDVDTYNHVLGALAHSNAAKAGFHAQRIFRRMKSPPPGYNTEPTQPNTLTYLYTLIALANSGRAHVAEQVFWDMFTERQGGNRAVQPNRKILNLVMYAWAKTRRVTDEERVRAILGLLQRVANVGDSKLKPCVTTCNILLQSLSKLNSDEARFKAESVLAELERDWERVKNESLQPDIISYSSVMRAHANVGDIHKTREVLDRALEAYRNGNEKARLDIIAFNHLLLAIARGARGRNLGAGKLAEDVFEQIAKCYAEGLIDELPNKTSYDMRISCWVNSGSKHAGDEAERILKTMKEMVASGFPDLEPDVISYTSAINAHAKGGNRTKAEELFQEMLLEYGKGNEKLKPNLLTINTLLSAIANSKEPDSGEKAESYFYEMLDAKDVLFVKPDAVTLSTVISAWAKSGDPRAAERTRALVREIETLSNKPGYEINLDAGFYKAVLKACASAGELNTAESLFDVLVRSDELQHIKPDRYMFHTLLNAYAKRQDVDSADEAEALLEEMKDLAASTDNEDLLPIRDTYMLVLECWANSERRDLAVERSEAILLEMEGWTKTESTKAHPTPATYNRVLNTLSRAGATERTKALLSRMYRKGGTKSNIAVPLHVPE